MPFNPYRPFRVPDHLNRSRFPVNMPHQQYRPAPTRTTSFDGWHARAPARPQFVAPNYTPSMNSRVPYNPHQGTPSSTAYTPKSTDLGQSYFSPGVTPDIQEETDLWDEGKALGESHPFFLLNCVHSIKSRSPRQEECSVRRFWIRAGAFGH